MPLVLHGMAIGVPPDVFQPNKPYAGCKLCGVVFQPKRARVINGNSPLRWHDPHSNLENPEYSKVNEIIDTLKRWQEWHTRRYHTQHDIELLRLSGRFCTPEAAIKLAPYGIIPIGDVTADIQHNEIDHALFEAHRAPEEPVSERRFS